MEPFLAKPKSAIHHLLTANDGFRSRIRSTTPSHQLPKSRLEALTDISSQIPTRAAALLQSIFLIEATSLDVCDMETRMQNESGRLADVLGDLGETVRDQHFIKKHFEGDLIALEECCNSLAAGLFPSCVQGLNKVNSKLWEFTNLQMVIYERTLKNSKLPGQQKQIVRSRFTDLRAPFDSLNTFLNDLALRSVDGSSIESRFDHMTGVLSETKDKLKASLKHPEFAEFKTILKSSIDIAHDLQAHLQALRVPVFPGHEELEELAPCVPQKLYSNLTGLEAFALLNISARMRSITLGRLSMLSPEFDIQVFDVFPDRIYFSANKNLVSAVKESGLFGTAEAALHKFRAGSYKQNTFGVGNLQICYSAPENGRINVDADIDLYRDPVRHLFGEVLRNHLTGKKTDAYKVRSILDDHEVAPVGGFRIFSLA